MNLEVNTNKNLDFIEDLIKIFLPILILFLGIFGKYIDLTVEQQASLTSAGFLGTGLSSSNKKREE